MQKQLFFNRDLSWLSFNERVLMEAEATDVPLLERLKFLAIFSSNLDEFYRVRMPVLITIHQLHQKNKATKHPDVLQQAQQIIHAQQERFGTVLSEHILPALEQHQIYLLYDKPLPFPIRETVTTYFYTTVLGFLHLSDLSKAGVQFFPENNKLYLALVLQDESGGELFKILNIPSDYLPRFFSVEEKGRQYILFLDDIIKANIQQIINCTVLGCYSFKITRDAELNLENEYEGNIRNQIEKRLQKRDYGPATRFLHEPEMPAACREAIQKTLSFTALPVAGGRYHNLKDFMDLPAKAPHLLYDTWPGIQNRTTVNDLPLLDQVARKDICIHTPYESYDTVIQFFNEAAWHPDVKEINTTMYRIASNSKIAYALISAAKNGKKVAVFVELKARFDEANNLKWAKLLKAAGVRIIYSLPGLKVHAKFALVKIKSKSAPRYIGMLATGNLNENTARIYTDHILLTAHQPMLQEMDSVFAFLKRRKLPGATVTLTFNHLLVAQFNLQQQFLQLIENEIQAAKEGKPAMIIIKMNNLEERKLIAKLYEASNAGVHITLIVRGICCLVPGVAGMSEHIVVRRIVDRYLEHGRVFIFHNNGDTKIYMGSADWMNRNIYSRVEVCFPVYDERIKKELLSLMYLQLQDGKKAVQLDQHLANGAVPEVAPVASQQQIYRFFKDGEPK